MVRYGDNNLKNGDVDSNLARAKDFGVGRLNDPGEKREASFSFFVIFLFVSSFGIWKFQTFNF